MSGLGPAAAQADDDPPCTQGFELPKNVCATTSAAEAIKAAQYAIHAVPVQHSREFLQSIKVRTHPGQPGGAQRTISIFDSGRELTTAVAGCCLLFRAQPQAPPPISSGEATQPRAVA